jgi:hypothetical protein
MVPGETALDRSVCVLDTGAFAEYENVEAGGDRLIEDVCGWIYWPYEA